MSDDSPSQEPNDETRRSYLCALGSLIVNWNQAENSLRRILIDLCGASPAIWLLTAELGSVSLENALKSASFDIGPARLSPYIDHCIEWFSRLREYRNYYVHSINDIGLNSAEKVVGVYLQVSAKKRITVHSEFIGLDRINKFNSDVIEFLNFVSDVQFHVSAHPLTEFPDGRPFPPLPEMPLLPDRLQKPRQYLTADPLRPPSSPGK
jgi:hypothetical protein